MSQPNTGTTLMPSTDAAQPAAAAGHPLLVLPWHQRMSRLALIVAVIGSLCALAVLALLLAPGVRSALDVEIADGVSAFAVLDGEAAGAHGGGGAADAQLTADADVSVVPAAQWSVQPDPERSGVLVRSPDGALTVTLTPVAAREADAALDAASRAAGGPVLAEALVTGAELRHLTDGEEFTGVLTGMWGSHADAVLVRAAVGRGADLADYRTALTELLETVTVQR